MMVIDRYILMAVFRPLAAALIIALLAHFLERLVILFELVANKGDPLFLVLNMLYTLVPGFLSLAIPAVFFVSIVLAMARLSVDYEYDAIQAMGVGPLRLLLPI